MKGEKMDQKKSFTVTTRSGAETVIVGDIKTPADRNTKKIKDPPDASATGQAGGVSENKN
jgi:hypothetical protein